MSALGAIFGLVLAIFLIIKKLSPVYSLIIGAMIGALIGGLSLVDSVKVMTDGVKDVTPAIIRILTAGVLSGALIKSGAATTISNAIIRFMGERFVLTSLAITTMLLCGVGVFIDVAVITVAPIALTIGNKLRIPTPVLLLAMIGGGKCGNIISPNPNTIIAAENFGADLSMVMVVNIIPAIVGLLFTLLVAVKLMPKYGPVYSQVVTVQEEQNLPSLRCSLVAPAVTIILLALRPIFGITIDPLIALPIGGIAGMVAMGQTNRLLESTEFGLQKMSGIAILLIGTGTIAGVIKSSSLKDWILSALSGMNLNEAIIAPVSGALMSAATASTTAGATIASASFSDTILSVGISGVWGAAMINAGATVLDHLPHGSFFNATGGVCELNFKERLWLIPYETMIGIVLATGSTIAYLMIV